MFGRQR